VIIAGQAASHCVKSTVDDLIAEAQARDPDLVRKITLLTDCMSAVTVPDAGSGWAVDFTPQVDEALARYEEAGVQLRASTQGL
ncbi:MAG: nicotinamidase, partial [Myxococcota bacterium]